MMSETPVYINAGGRLLDLSTPCVMGILNLTPDSFYAGSRKQTEAEIEARAETILNEGGTIIDIGGYSSRPDAAEVSEEAVEKMLPPMYGNPLEGATAG